MTTIADLKPDPKNARKRGPRAEGMIVKSLQEVGAARSIVIDEDNRILAGNGTVQAAAEAGIERVHVVEADGETIIAVRRKGLTESQKKRLAVLDNRTGELAEWDAEILSELSGEIDLTDLWNPQELEDLLCDVMPVTLQTDPDEIPENVETRCKLGDLWQLGEHRLLCGDSTSATDVERLMGDEPADSVFSDPPYNVGREYGEATDDNRSAENYALWTNDWILPLRDTLPFGADLWVTPGHRFLYQTQELLAASFSFIWTIAWMKLNSMMRAPTGFNTWEPILWLRQGIDSGYGLKRYDTVNVPMALDSTTLGHPTPKPIKLLTELFLIKGDNCRTVYDPFAGSGTTLIACEQTGRAARCMEIEPRYCDVILQRWENATGNQAELING